MPSSPNNADDDVGLAAVDRRCQDVAVALDGVYVRGADGRLSFRRVIPHTEDIERLVLEIAARCEAWLERQGFGADEEVDPEEDDSLSLLQQASVGGYVAVGARARRQVRRVRRVQTLGGRQVALPRGWRTATAHCQRRPEPR